MDAPTGYLQNPGDHDDHDQRDWKKDFPTKTHQLIVAIARHKGLDQGEHEKDEGEFQDEPDEPGHPGKGNEGQRRQPAAKEQDRRHGAHGEDGDIFSEEKEKERSRGIFDSIACDKFGLGFHQIERRTVGLRQGRDEEDDEHREQRQPIPADKAQTSILRSDNVGEVERSGAQQHRDDHEADRDFVRDHLRRGAQSGEERIFRIRRPAGHDDSIDAKRGNREKIEYADIDVADRPTVRKRDHRPSGKREDRRHQRRQKEYPLIGAGGNQRLLDDEFQKVGEALQQPPGPDDVRAAAKLNRRPDFAIGVKDIGGEEQQGDEQDDALDRITHHASKLVLMQPIPDGPNPADLDKEPDRQSEDDNDAHDAKD